MTREQTDAAAEFFAAAVSKFGTQVELAAATGLSQPTINGIISRKYGAGHKSLLAVSRATGVPVEEILSGAGTLQLKSRSGIVSAKNDLNRLRAIRALSELFSIPIAEVSALFDQLGTTLPVEVSATVWFDVGRAALERRSAGKPLVKRIE